MYNIYGCLCIIIPQKKCLLPKIFTLTSTNFHMYLEENSHRIKSKDSILLYSYAI